MTELQRQKVSHFARDGRFARSELLPWYCVEFAMNPLRASKVSPCAARTIRATRVACLAAALSLAPVGLAYAAADAKAQAEIDHLLDFVGASNCTFFRNGSSYPSAEAKDHLQMKYRFAGSRVSTAEEFIEYLATGSSVSGEPYHVTCGKQDVPAGAWLADELRRYRKAAQ
jgi:Family of unknown function (DUF5329)